MMVSCKLFIPTKEVWFENYNWQIKAYKEKHGPGSNYWSAKNVEIMPDGIMLKIVPGKKKTTCSEIKLFPLREIKGTYIVHTIGNIDQLDKHTVFGIFLYEKTSKKNIELDIEYTKWGQEYGKNTHFTIHNVAGKTSQKSSSTLKQNGSYLTHVIQIKEGKVSLGYFHGHLSIDEINLEQLTTFSGVSLNQEKVYGFHINLWRYKGFPANKMESIIISGFKHHG